MSNKPRIVALEEHYIDPDRAPLLYGTRHDNLSEMERRLLDLGTERLREMDDAGIDVQGLSHGAPACQQLDPETAVRMSRQTNDRLHLVVQDNPSRFAAFGILPTPDP